MSEKSQRARFDEWFIEEFGKRENFFAEHCDKALMESLKQLEFARKEMKSRIRWDEQRAAAFSAWVVKDEEKL